MVPAPYDFAWTSRLIGRDLKNLARRVKTKASKKAEKLFRSSEHAADIKPSADIEPIGINTQLPTHEATPPLAPESFSPTEVRVGSTEQCEIDVSGRDPGPKPNPTFPVPKCGTFYELMESKVNEWYKTRPTDLPLEERFKVRGTALLLYIALQTCSSNPSFDILRNGKPTPSEATFILGILGRSHILISFGQR